MAPERDKDRSLHPLGGAAESFEAFEWIEPESPAPDAVTADDVVEDVLDELERQDA